MSYQPLTITDTAWDTLVRTHPRGHFLQLAAWGRFKALYGWQPVIIALTDATGTACTGAQLLLRPLPFKLGTLAYLPFAPLVDWSDMAQVQAIFQAIEAAAKHHRAIFLKVEPGHEVPSSALEKLGFHLSSQTVQPPNTVILELDGEENVLKRMNQGTRRNIRKSEKFEVQIRPGTRADVDNFNAMLDETGRRQGFGVHVTSYYEHAYNMFVPNGDAALFMGSYGGVDLAAVFVFKVGKRAWYLYGASRDVERQRMAAFGVQWAAIQWAMAQGCTLYDMYGIPDEPLETLEAHFETREDDLWGVYRFKRGWGGQVARTVGAWDKIYNRPLYWLYQQYIQRRRAGGME